MRSTIFFVILLYFIQDSTAQYYSLRIGLLKYRGGGDWYANPTAIKNLANFCNNSLGMNIDIAQAEVEPSSPELFNYKFIHTTGHGNIIFNNEEARNIRQWLMAGGFWHVDDNYGMDKYIRPIFKQVFPELDLVEIPFNHPLYSMAFPFSNGLPKIHEHDSKPPKGYGLLYEGRVVVFYSSECDLGDGWEDPEVHKDPEEKRQAALRMGANLILYACEY